MTRRAALGAAGAGALGWALWPRRPRSMQAAPSGRVVIDYWEKWTGPEGEAIQEMVDAFNASQERTWVRRVAVSDITSKAMVATGGGDPPDVLGLFSYSVPQFAEAGAIYSLDEFAREPGAIDPTVYAPAVRRLLSHGGRQWAGVSSLYNLALYYNRAMLHEAGADPEQPPRTIPELDALAERFVRRDAEGQLTRAGFLANLPAWWPYFWPLVFGGELYDPEKDRAVLTDDATVAAYQWVQDSAARVGAAAGARFSSAYGRSFHSPSDPFISGHVAMIVQGPWLANFLRLYNPGLDYGAVPFPTAPGVQDPSRPLGMLEADVLMIPRGARHPGEAFAFVSYMQRQSVQERFARLHCKGSPMREVSPGFYDGHPNRCVAVHDAITASPRVAVLPQTRVWQAYADMMVGMFDSIWNGRPVRPLLLDVEQRAQGMMDRAAALRRKREGRTL